MAKASFAFSAWLGAVAAFCLSSPAFSQMPPKKYDHAYKGEVIKYLVPYGKAWETCNRVSLEIGSGPWPKTSKMIQGRHLYGCSMGVTIDEKPGCIIVYSWSTTDKAMKSNVFRHEQAHCNGWPSHHPQD